MILIRLALTVAWVGLRLVGVCFHSHRRRERDDDQVLWLVCEACGHRVPALERTDEERDAMLDRWPPVPPSRARRQPPVVE
jgi:hypothetical protein